VFASGLGLVSVVIGRFNSAEDADFAHIAAIAKRLAFAERELLLINFDGPF
jgi:hypothetical protein